MYRGALDVPEVALQGVVAGQPRIPQQPQPQGDRLGGVPVRQDTGAQRVFGEYEPSAASTRSAPVNTRCSAESSRSAISPATRRKRSVRATGWPRLAGTRSWAKRWT
ncbi:hypothetical protein [Streptomyces rhizosphaericus]|uniref:hypothetical protein n=1 Tax=Streptomyces rhizosphaericus TaxID=114699 RepID=UPI003630E6A6